jgi:hypothetical protein
MTKKRISFLIIECINLMLLLNAIQNSFNKLNFK